MDAMKLAIPDYLLPGDESQRLAKAAEWGGSGLELCTTPLTGPHRLLMQKDGPERWREWSAHTGVALASLSIQSLVWPGQFPRLEDVKVYMKQEIPPLIDRAVEAGIATVHLPIYDPPELRPTESEAFWMNALTPVIEQAERHVMPLALETFWPAEVCRQFLAKLPSSRLCISYDLGNAHAVKRDPLAELHLLEPVLGQIRLKERQRREPYGLVPLGSGQLDWNRLGPWLHEFGQKKWLILASALPSEQELAVRNQIRFIHSRVQPKAAA